MANEVFDRILAALEGSDRIDASRIDLEFEGDEVVVSGAVASAEEATWVETVVARFASNVTNNLRVDRGLREGIVEPTAAEPVVPAEGEVLVGSTDMLAGPEAEVTSDISIALQENVPWDPPEEPLLAPTASEYGGEVSFGDGDPGAAGEGVPATVDPGDFSAPDLTKEDLEAAAKGSPVPSLDPDYVAPSSLTEEEPLAMDPLGARPPESLTSFPDPLPGARAGAGATGEGTAGGGSISGVPAVETGAPADTAAADPVAPAGGSMTDIGTDPGPDAEDDPASRQDLPDGG